MPPFGHSAEKLQAPLVEHVSIVHGLPSLQSAAEQHARHAAPQSCGVLAAHWQLPPEQMAPGLQTLPQLPQLEVLLSTSVSQPSL